VEGGGGLRGMCVQETGFPVLMPTLVLHGYTIIQQDSSGQDTMLQSAEMPLSNSRRKRNDSFKCYI
jgi:hypothetical protein